MADMSKILSPRSENRRIGRLFNKLLSKSFASAERGKQSYVDISITKQKKFLEMKVPKVFPSYHVYTRKRTKSPKITGFEVPQLKLTPRNLNVFKFKEEALAKLPKKGCTSTGRKREKNVYNSVGESSGLISLLRESTRERKRKEEINLSIFLTKTNCNYF